MSAIYKAGNGYELLARALEPLEIEGRLRYLPSFECCGSCAGAAIEEEDWGDSEFYVTFNEQTKESADFNFELRLASWSFDPDASEEEEKAVEALVAEALTAGGFEEVDKPTEESSYRPLHDPQFRFNSFYRDGYGIVVRGVFEGDALPTDAVIELNGYQPDPA